MNEENIVICQHCSKKFDKNDVVKCNQYNIDYHINTCKLKHNKENIKTKPIGSFFGNYI